MSEELQAAFADLAAKQEPLPPDIAALLTPEALWDLYVEDDE